MGFSFYSPCLAGVVLLSVLTGCSGSQHQPQNLYFHALRFDEDGRPLDPRDGHRMSAGEILEQRQQIFSNIERELTNKPRKLLIFVHGGLNDPDDASARALKTMARMQRPPNAGFPYYEGYPLFVIWDSNLFHTYWEHLASVRQGRKDELTEQEGAFSWPLYLFSDVLRAFARAPTVWLQQAANDADAGVAGFNTLLNSRFNQWKNANPAQYEKLSPEDKRQIDLLLSEWANNQRNINVVAFYNTLRERYVKDFNNHHSNPTTQMAISLGPDRSMAPGLWGRAVARVLTVPTKLLGTPVIDALGLSAWQDMSRRTLTVVEGTSELLISRNMNDQEIAHYIDKGSGGGLDQFMSALSEWCNRQPAQSAYEITLVGHSMGTMILNDVLRARSRYEGGPHAALPVKNIVYLAAACSIRDFSQGVIPFMEQAAHRDVQFYNLCLHPTADLIDTEASVLVQQGSLLCWIDAFLGEPATPLDRTLGRFDNIVQVPFVIPERLRGRVAIKAFCLLQDQDKWNLGPDPQPQKHGDFSESPYWDVRFWQPDQPGTPPSSP